MAACVPCGQPLRPEARFCTHCGTSVAIRGHEEDVRDTPSILEPALPPRSRGSGRFVTRKLPVVVGGVMAALAVGIGGTLLVLRPWQGPTSPATPPASVSSPTQSSPPERRTTLPGPGSATVTASALCVSPGSHDKGGNPTSYEPQKAVDGDPTTAWRCGGNGIGQQLTLRFDRTVTLTRIGLIPGLAKTDPYDGTDRYVQNRRIAQVRYTFDNGKTASQDFDVSDSNRSVQYLSLRAIETSTVTITVLSSVPGSRQNGQDPAETVGISEVSFS